MKKLAIFASGSGTNAENIARLFHQGNRVRVAVVLCNRKNAGVYARMQALNVPVVYVPNSAWDGEPQQVLDILNQYSPDLIVLAGFMRAVRPEIIDAYPERIINIHPSLLPAYGGKGMYGHHVHEAVIAAGESKSGVTVHYVSREIDGGEILMQQSVDVLPSDTAETLEAKIHPVEYSLYPRAIVAALSRIEGTDVTAAVEAIGKTRDVDSAWAERLHLQYDEHEAAERRAQVELRARPASGAGQAQPAPHPAVPQPQLQPQQTQRPQPQQPMPAPPVPTQDLPKSHLAAAILVTVLCCVIPGVIAIVYSSTVSSRLAASDIEGARKASARAEGWIIASFVLGLLSATLWFPVTFITSMLQ